MLRRQKVARFRPVALLGSARQLCPGISALDFLGDFEGVVDLNAEIPHRTFNFRGSEQELNSSKVASAAVDQRRLGPANQSEAARGANVALCDIKC